MKTRQPPEGPQLNLGLHVMGSYVCIAASRVASDWYQLTPLANCLSNTNAHLLDTNAHRSGCVLDEAPHSGAAHGQKDFFATRVFSHCYIRPLYFPPVW